MVTRVRFFFLPAVSNAALSSRTSPGHTNCGKSTLVNALSGIHPRRGPASTSDRAGWTDLVGFYQVGKKPPVLTLVSVLFPAPHSFSCFFVLRGADGGACWSLLRASLASVLSVDSSRPKRFGGGASSSRGARKASAAGSVTRCFPLVCQELPRAHVSVDAPAGDLLFIPGMSQASGRLTCARVFSREDACCDASACSVVVFEPPAQPRVKMRCIPPLVVASVR